MKILGAVLAGGQSRRFGSDKAEAVFEGRRLIDHAINTLEAQADQVAICGREEPGRLSLTDRPETGIGPLGGLSAALHYAAANEYDAVLTSGCDAPDLPDTLFEQLLGIGAAIAETQPVIGLWPCALSDTLDDFIANGGRALYGFADSVGARRVKLDPPLANINSPVDLEHLKR